VSLAPEAQVDPASLPDRTAARGGRHRVLAATGLVMIVAVLTGAVLLETQYQPLRLVGVLQDARPGSLYHRSQVDMSGPATIEYFYCSVPNARFAAMIVITNTGPLPVTILGGVPGPGAVTPVTNVNGFSLIDLATYDPMGTGDPQAAPVLPATTLGQGEMVEAWARFQIGAMGLSPGASMGLAGLFIRYAVLELERTTLVPLDETIAIEGCP